MLKQPDVTDAQCDELALWFCKNLVSVPDNSMADYRLFIRRWLASLTLANTNPSTPGEKDTPSEPAVTKEETLP